jgi:hypothetical protein
MMMRGKVKVRLNTCFRGFGFLFLSAWSLTLAVVPALAQTVAVPSQIDRNAGDVPAQKYDGVVPSPTAKNPLPSVPPGGGTYLVWTGFQMTNTGSQVFLQTTAPVVPEPGKSSKSVLAVVLRGCRIHMANNRRKIDTRFFATPVASVSAKQKGRDVEVRIGVREPVSAEPRTQAGPEGSQFVVFDFPPGKAASEPSAAQEKSSALQDLAGSDSDNQDDAGSDSDRKAGKRRGMKAAAKSSE